MLKILGKIILSLALLIYFIVVLLITSLWANKHKKISIIMIQDFMDLWDINMDEFYVRKGR